MAVQQVSGKSTGPGRHVNPAGQGQSETGFIGRGESPPIQRSNPERNQDHCHELELNRHFVARAQHSGGGGLGWGWQPASAARCRGLQGNEFRFLPMNRPLVGRDRRARRLKDLKGIGRPSGPALPGSWSLSMVHEPRRLPMNHAVQGGSARNLAFRGVLLLRHPAAETARKP
jgi:hypothetical protein